MAPKKKPKKIDWLMNWENSYDWSGQTADQINASKLEIEDYVESYLNALDKGQQITDPTSQGHKIKFDWFTGPGSQFIVSAYLTPPCIKTGPPPGSGQTQLSPTPPPQP